MHNVYRDIKIPTAVIMMSASSFITKYTGVMVFYAVLTYILFPAIAYLLFGKTLESVGNGFIVGSIVSVVLWKVYGFGLVGGGGG